MSEETQPAATDLAFEIRRTFNAPRTAVWRAWTEADRLQKWFMPKGFAMPDCTLDCRVGGHFHYHLTTPQGQELWGLWEFREIAAPERLAVVQSFADAERNVARHPFGGDWPLRSLATKTLAEADGRTTLTVRWVPIEPTAAEEAAFAGGFDSMRAGWTGTLDHLAAYLATSGTADR